MSRVAVLGAGPCGLSLLRAFSTAEKSGEHIPEIVCFEKQSDWGGMWNYTWRTGLDQHGEPVHGSMYKHMYSNVPKEYHEYSDYSFDQHFKKPVPSYLPRESVREYFLARAENYNIRRFIKFNTAVKYVDYHSGKEQFSIRVTDLTSGENRIEYFDFVAVATGHLSIPNVPSFDGIESFPGRIIHSHNFRDAKEFKGQHILVIGGSLSAEDIALQTYKFGAKSVTISYRTRPLNLKWPAEVEELPLLTRIEGRSVHFRDGSQRNFDSIIMCTGYQHHFTFMADDLRLVTRNRQYPDHLYKGLLFHSLPRLAYLGMQNLTFSFPGLDIEAWYVYAVILNRIKIPSQDERLRDMENWQVREKSISGFKEAVDFMTDYFEELMALSNYQDYNIRTAADRLQAGWRDKQEDIVSYRDKSLFTSISTGTASTANNISWIEDKEDKL